MCVCVKFKRVIWSLLTVSTPLSFILSSPSRSHPSPRRTFVRHARARCHFPAYSTHSGRKPPQRPSLSPSFSPLRTPTMRITRRNQVHVYTAETRDMHTQCLHSTHTMYTQYWHTQTHTQPHTALTHIATETVIPLCQTLRLSSAISLRRFLRTADHSAPQCVHCIASHSAPIT